VHRRVGGGDKAVDLVACFVAADSGADVLDDTGEVPSERHRELVLGHFLEHPGRDRNVGTVDRRGVHAHEHFIRTYGRRR
jgi:hypothetical protein